jgi:UDP-N-acetylmuramate-alanine ligase
LWLRVLICQETLVLVRDHAFINALATIAMAAAHGSCERVAQAIGGGTGVVRRMPWLLGEGQMELPRLL